MNEEKIITQFCQNLKRLKNIEDVVIVDGGSKDKTAKIASNYFKVVSAPVGRARQMNEGAKEAKGDILFFLHADVKPHPDSLVAIQQTFSNKSIVGGFFRLKLNDKRFIYRIIEIFSDWRARFLGAVFGDQGIFVREEIFKEVDGYPEIDLLEDWEFIKKIKRFGKVKRLSNPIKASVRRWENAGRWRTIWYMQLIKILYGFGVHPNKLKALYKDVR